MLVAPVDLELGGHLPAHLALGQHALDRVFHNLLRPARQEANERLFAQPTGKPGVAAVDLLLALQAGQHNLLRVDHDHVVTHVDEGGVFRVFLAAQHAGRFSCQASQGLAAGVNDEPFAGDIVRARKIRRHRYLLLPEEPSWACSAHRKNLAAGKMLSRKRKVLNRLSGEE